MNNKQYPINFFYDQKWEVATLIITEDNLMVKTALKTHCIIRSEITNIVENTDGYGMIIITYFERTNDQAIKRNVHMNTQDNQALLNDLNSMMTTPVSEVEQIRQEKKENKKKKSNSTILGIVLIFASIFGALFLYTKIRAANFNKPENLYSTGTTQWTHTYEKDLYSYIFFKDGECRYDRTVRGKREIINCTFTLKNDTITIKYPSEDKEEKYYYELEEQFILREETDFFIYRQKLKLRSTKNESPLIYELKGSF